MSGTQASCSTAEPATQGVTRRGCACSSSAISINSVQDAASTTKDKLDPNNPIGNVNKSSIVPRKQSHSELTPSDHSTSSHNHQHLRMSITDKSSSQGFMTTMSKSTLAPISEFDELDELELEPSSIDYNMLQTSQSILSVLSHNGNDVSEPVLDKSMGSNEDSEEFNDDDSELEDMLHTSWKKRQSTMTKSTGQPKGPVKSKNRKAPSNAIKDNPSATSGKLQVLAIKWSHAHCQVATILNQTLLFHPL